MEHLQMPFFLKEKFIPLPYKKMVSLRNGVNSDFWSSEALTVLFSGGGSVTFNYFLVAFGLWAGDN